MGPTDPAITVEEIANLEPIPNTWLHMRVTFPNDEEFEQIRSIYPEQTQMEYQIPYIHMRGMFARNYEESIKGKEVKP